MNQPPPPHWSQPPQGYPPPPGFAPQGPPPGAGPPGKRPFRFQMWMLGAIIVPIGIGIAIRDVLKRGTIELGGECSDSEHCKSHTCLTGDTGICTMSCSAASPCPAGFACEKVSVTLQNQAGFHDLGAQMYCMPGPAGAPSSAPTSGPSRAAEEDLPSTPSADPAPPPDAPSAGSAAPLASSKPTKRTPKPKPKPTKK